MLIGGLYPDTPFAAGINLTYKNLLSDICEVVTKSDDSDPDIDLFICVDFNKNDVDYALEKGIARSKSLLIRQEPKIVWPDNYCKEVTRYFGYILDVGKSPRKTNSDFWPQIIDLDSKIVPPETRESHQVVLMNSNRCSLLKGERYSLRKSAAKKITEVDLYGRDWDISFTSKIKLAISSLKLVLRSGNIPSLLSLGYWLSSAPSSFGSVGVKNELLTRYRYSLVIENEQTYVSEKIFDSFRAKCIPVYVGPDLREFGIPENLYVTAEPNISSIQRAIFQLKDLDYEIWQQDLNEGLSQSTTIERWSYLNFSKRIQELVLKKID